MSTVGELVTLLLEPFSFRFFCGFFEFDGGGRGGIEGTLADTFTVLATDGTGNTDIAFAIALANASCDEDAPTEAIILESTDEEETAFAIASATGDE